MMKKTKQTVLAFLVLLFPGMVYANAGVPMLYLAMPAFLFSLVPIIGIETVYISKGLELSLGQSLKTVSISNLVSTIIGIPLTWCLLAAIQMISGGGGAYGIDSVVGKILAVTWQAPWLMPYENDMNWMIPLAGLILLVPFFFASWWSEFFVTKKMNCSLPLQKVKRKVRNANLVTYTLLAAWPVGFWFIS